MRMLRRYLDTIEIQIKIFAMLKHSFRNAPLAFRAVSMQCSLPANSTLYPVVSRQWKMMKLSFFSGPSRYTTMAQNGSSDYLDIKNLQVALIDGEYFTTEKKFDVINPATGEVIGTAPNCGPEHAVKAIEAAAKAFKTYKKFTVRQRHDLLMKWYQLIEAHGKELSWCIHQENGKPLNEAVGEVSYASNFPLWFAGQVRSVSGETIPCPFPNKRYTTKLQPLGVCSMIIPWNVPAAMLTRKVAPALAVGCTVVIKPSEDTPFNAVLIAKLAEEAGFPKGVVNVITCDRESVTEVGKVLCTHPTVKKISFTGSSIVGKTIMNWASSTIKKISLELGGNGPFIVFDDANIDAAVSGLLACKFRVAGQTCVNANRVFVHEKVFDKFSKQLCEAISKIPVGNDAPTNGTKMGPLINQRGIEKASRLVKAAIAGGAKVLYDGKTQAEDYSKGKGTFFYPMVIDGRALDTSTPEKCPIYHEEIFAPVVTLYSFASEEEAVEKANHVPFGLASYFYTSNLKRATLFAEELETGMVGLNTGVLSFHEHPFGGEKQSGIGREGGRIGLEEFCNIKYICEELVD